MKCHTTPCECGELLALYSFARIQDAFIIISEVDSERIEREIDTSGEDVLVPDDFWSESTIAERVWQSFEGFEDWVLSHSVWIGCGICAKPQHDFDSKNLNQIWITYIERELVHASQDTLKRFDDSIDVILRDEEYLNIRDYLTPDLAVLECSFRALPEITQTYLPKLQQLLEGQE